MLITALILDDEKLARSRLKRLLGRYESIEIVGEARNGREALRLIEESRPDVLFLDIKMPFLSGFEMLGKLGERIFIIPDHEIVFFHSEDKYTFLNTTEKNYIIPFTLKELEARLDPECFIRVHRASIVNIEHIGSIHKWFGGRLLIKMKNGKEFTVSQNYVNDFKAKIHL